jgi:hypothetical protein
MSERGKKWQEDWHTGAWASTRAIWRRGTPEEDALDDATWKAACADPGSPIAVILAEIRQLLEDVFRPAREPD